MLISSAAVRVVLCCFATWCRQNAWECPRQCYAVVRLCTWFFAVWQLCACGCGYINVAQRCCGVWFYSFCCAHTLPFVIACHLCACNLHWNGCVKVMFEVCPCAGVFVFRSPVLALRTWNYCVNAAVSLHFSLRNSFKTLQKGTSFGSLLGSGM